MAAWQLSRSGTAGEHAHLGAAVTPTDFVLSTHTTREAKRQENVQSSTGRREAFTSSEHKREFRRSSTSCSRSITGGLYERARCVSLAPGASVRVAPVPGDDTPSLGQIRKVISVDEAADATRYMDRGWILLAVHQRVDTDGYACTSFVLGLLRSDPTDPPEKVIGRNIKALRKRLKLSQEEFGQRLSESGRSYTERTVRDWETNGLADLRQVTRIAEALGVRRAEQLKGVV